MLCAAKMSGQQRNDTTLKSTTIEVLQSYKPEVKQAPKPEFKPELPPIDTSRPVFRYEVPQQALYYSYASLPLRPLALGKDSSRLPFQNYVKLGVGTQSTLYGDAGIVFRKEGDYDATLHLHHLSQSGNLDHQKISLSGLEAEGTLHRSNHALTLSLEGMRNRYHFYGYDQSVWEIPQDSVQQTYTGVKAMIGVQNERTNRLGIDYHPRVGIQYYTDAFNASERTFIFDVPFTKRFDTTLALSVGASGLFTNLKTDLRDWNNNVFQLTPQLRFQKNGFSGRVGVFPTFTNFYSTLFLPAIEARYRFPGETFTIAAGWEGKLRQNTLQQLSSVNPYLYPLSGYVSYRIRPTHTEEVYGMVSVSVGSHLTISGRVSWWQFKNLPMYLNDSLDGKNFSILYDPQVNALSVQGAVHYQVASRFSLGLTGTLTNFNKKTYQRVWHEPGVRLNASMLLQPIPQLSITANAIFLDQIYARNTFGQEVKLKAAFDLGFSAEYAFIPRLAVFVNLSNLLNNSYQRWYGYDSFGINLTGGLRLKF